MIGTSWQYLTEATRGAYDPALDTSDTREERIAALRIVLYSPSPLCVTLSVHAECERIKDRGLWRDNAGMRDVFLHEVQPRDLDPVTIALRVVTLRAHHDDPDDCRAIAEAEVAGMARLLTFDKRLIKRLTPRAGISLITPSAYWLGLGIPRGTKPRAIPALTNPLAAQSWWR